MNLARITLAATLALAAVHAPAQETFTGWLFTLDRMKEVRPVTDTTWQTECGECHLAYQPGLLPARSWEALLRPESLGSHFGVNAEIAPAALASLREYALAYAADRSYYKRARKIAAANASGPTPLRISEMPLIVRTHADIPARLIAGNPAVKTLSQCDRCHTQAKLGVYDNDTVAIPNAPR